MILRDGVVGIFGRRKLGLIPGEHITAHFVVHPSEGVRDGWVIRLILLRRLRPTQGNVEFVSLLSEKVGKIVCRVILVRIELQSPSKIALGFLQIALSLVKNSLCGINGGFRRSSLSKFF